MKILYWAIVPLFCVVVGSVLSSPRTGKQQESVGASPSPTSSISTSASPSPTPSVKPKPEELTVVQVNDACSIGLYSAAVNLATAEGRLIADERNVFNLANHTNWSAWEGNRVYIGMAKYAIPLSGGYEKAYRLTKGQIESDCKSVFDQAKAQYQAE